MSAREVAEVIEVLELAIETLEDSKEFEQENVLSSWRKRFWETRGEGGATLNALRDLRDRLRERGN